MKSHVHYPKEIWVIQQYVVGKNAQYISPTTYQITHISTTLTMLFGITRLIEQFLTQILVLPGKVLILNILYTTPTGPLAKKVDRLQFALLSPTNIIQVTVLAVTRQISFILKKNVYVLNSYLPTSIYLKNFPEAEIIIP